jgi:hypothetical protein
VSDDIAVVVPVADGVYASSTTLSGTSGFLLPAKRKVIAAWVGSLHLEGSRFKAPSFYQVAPPHIRPSMRATLPGSDPNMQVLFDEPIQLSENEVLAVEAAHSHSSAETVTALVWLADDLEPAPAGQSFWIRYTSSGAVTSGLWSRITITLDQPLPDGTYAVVGMEHWSQTCIAARLVFPGRESRPGVLGLSGTNGARSQRTHAVFYEGGLGLYGKFMSYTLPQVEVLATGTDNSHIGYLRIIQLGNK